MASTSNSCATPLPGPLWCAGALSIVHIRWFPAGELSMPFFFHISVLKVEKPMKSFFQIGHFPNSSWIAEIRVFTVWLIGRRHIKKLKEVSLSVDNPWRFELYHQSTRDTWIQHLQWRYLFFFCCPAPLPVLLSNQP